MTQPHHGASDPGAGEMRPEGQGDVALESKDEVVPPKHYKVLLHNDDYTTMEFVVLVLAQVFFRPEPEAVRIMLHVHQEGVGVAGVYSYEVAESRIAKVARMAREHEFPLRCSMEPA